MKPFFLYYGLFFLIPPVKNAEKEKNRFLVGCIGFISYYTCGTGVAERMGLTSEGIPETCAHNFDLPRRKWLSLPWKINDVSSKSNTLRWNRLMMTVRYYILTFR